ncbi:hypothetical protein [Alteribacter natronophilus]|uniref:hypothetical protein n=1 Tax=Alteribacter natronophilus TaxID=2583810 RepID=UPI00110E6F5E|nr:hypothetical protein [Alteribacter natronophilus]TMW70434.1 hypothetical protein FGB90_17360 [Alteribacter natronophilus]
MWYYDDEESGERIDTDNWKFANYALQSMTGLLGENDILNVIRMSSADEVLPIELTYSERQKEIQNIEQWEERGNTPFETVETAFEHIRTSHDSDPEDDYWFIIVMDGAFNDLDYTMRNDTELEQNRRHALDTMQDFQEEMEQREASFHAIFVTFEAYVTNDERIMMQEFKEDFWDVTLQGEHLQASNEQEIIDRINEVAALITNRDPDSDRSGNILNPAIEGNKVTIESPYPLKRLTVLHQDMGDPAEHGITSVEVNGSSTGYEADGPYAIESPYDPAELRETLYGAVSHVSHDSVEGVIPEGRYTLTFADDVNPETMNFIAESSIDFNISTKRVEADGELTDDPQTFFAGTDMKLIVRFTERGGARETLTLPASRAEEMDVTAEIGEETYTLSWDEQMQAFTAAYEMPDDYGRAAVTGYIPGFYQETKELNLHGLEAREWTLQAENENWSAPMDEMGEAEPIVFIPYINEIPISESELASVFDDIEMSVDGGTFDASLKQHGSQINVVPESPRFPFLTNDGERTIELTVSGPYEGETASATASANVEPIGFWRQYGIYLSYLLLGILAVWYLIGIYKKPRFDKKNTNFIVKENHLRGSMARNRDEGETELIRTGFLQRWLVPYKAERTNIRNLEFIAGRTRNTVYLSHKSKTEGMKVDRYRLTQDEADDKKDLPVILGAEVVEQLHDYEVETKYNG